MEQNPETTKPDSETGNQPPVIDRQLFGGMANEEDSFSRLLSLVKHQAWIVVTFAFLGLVAGYIHNVRSPRLFTARALMEITADTANQFKLESQFAGAEDIDSTKIMTEIEVLQSSTLALETIQSLHLENNKEFSIPPRNHMWDLTNPHDRHALVGNLLSSLVTTRVGHTGMISIEYSSRDPELAANICNTLIDRYREDSFQNSYASTEQVSKWLQTKLGELRSRLEASQQRILDMQNNIGLVGLEGDQKQSIALSRLEEFNKDLASAEANRLVLEAKLVALKSAQPSVIDALSASPVINQLRQRKAILEEDYATTSSKYGSAYPRLISLKSEIAQIDKSIESEEATTIKRAENDVASAKASEKSLRSALNTEKDSTYATSSMAVQYSLAKQEYESNRTLYQSLEARLEEAGILASLHSSTVRIIEPAEPPDYPSSPRTRLNLGIGFLFGFVLGVVIASVRSVLDTNIKTISDVETKLGLPMLGLVPEVKGQLVYPNEFIDAATAVAERKWSNLVESFRVLRTSILMSQAGGPPNVIMVSSAETGEGKSAVSSLVAITLALNGARVLVIDTDLRRPTQHLRFHLANNKGLSSILSGSANVEETIYTVPSLPALRVLVSGPPPPMPAELLASQRMRDLLAEFRKEYDFIVLDTPPVLTVTDAAILGSVSDGVLLVLRYGMTKHNSVNRSIETLLRSGSQIIGAVVNAVDQKSVDYSAYYGHSYSDYFETEN